MKAIVCTKYGLPEVFQINDVEKPVCGDDEVLIEVHASSVTTHNLLMVIGKPFIVRMIDMSFIKPKVKTPGSDIAGRIESTGRNVKQFKPGDEVYGDISEYGFGGYSEYVTVPEKAIALKPVNISFEEAATVPQAALVALQGLRNKGQIKKGQKVLIYGASGGIGSFAVQIAKYYGAEVTGVCSTRSLDLVRSLGADHVIDYTKEDYTKSGKHYDLIFAIAYRSIFDHMRALAKGGIYVSTGGPSMSRVFQDMLIGPWIYKAFGKRLSAGWVVNLNKNDLLFVKDMIETGKIKPVIDRQYPLSETAEAFRYFAQGHSRGKVIITLKHNG